MHAESPFFVAKSRQALTFTRFGMHMITCSVIWLVLPVFRYCHERSIHVTWPSCFCAKVCLMRLEDVYSKHYSPQFQGKHRERIWETAYAVMDPRAKMLAGQSDCRMQVTSHAVYMFEWLIKSTLFDKVCCDVLYNDWFDCREGPQLSYTAKRNTVGRILNV